VHCAPVCWKLPGWPSKSIPLGKASVSERAARIGTPQAIVAIARTRLVAVWHVLSRQGAALHGSRAGRRTHPAPLDLPRAVVRAVGKRRSQAALLRHSLEQLGRGSRRGRNPLQWSRLAPLRRARRRRNAASSFSAALSPRLASGYHAASHGLDQSPGGLLRCAKPVLTRRERARCAGGKPA
jgi:hypothetical protein